MSSNRSRVRKEVLRKECEERKEAHDKLSLQEKIDRLPEGGAKKERARLEALLAKDQGESKKAQYEQYELSPKQKERLVTGDALSKFSPEADTETDLRKPKRNKK